MISSGVTKRKVFVVSAHMVVLFVLLFSLDATCDYGFTYMCARYWEQIRAFSEVMFVSIPLFLLSILTFFLREEVFKAWSRFALAWVPLTMVLAALSPEYNQSLLPFEKETVSFLFSLLFVIVSLLIIFIQSIRVYWMKK